MVAASSALKTQVKRQDAADKKAINDLAPRHSGISFVKGRKIRIRA